MLALALKLLITFFIYIISFSNKNVLSFKYFH